MYWLYWIFAILAALILLHLIWLLGKRCSLVRKISRCSKITWKRNRFASIFCPNGRVDCVVETEERAIAVSILTTPFRRCRYHFISESCMQIIFGRRRMYLFNAQSRGAGVTTIDNVIEFVKYRLDFFGAPEGMAHYVLVHPAPLELSRVDGTCLQAVSNNDELYRGIKICGGSYFVEHVLSDQSAK